MVTQVRGNLRIRLSSMGASPRLSKTPESDRLLGDFGQEKST